MKANKKTNMKTNIMNFFSNKKKLVKSLVCVCVIITLTICGLVLNKTDNKVNKKTGITTDCVQVNNKEQQRNNTTINALNNKDINEKKEYSHNDRNISGNMVNAEDGKDSAASNRAKSCNHTWKHEVDVDVCTKCGVVKTPQHTWSYKTILSCKEQKAVHICRGCNLYYWELGGHRGCPNCGSGAYASSMAVLWGTWQYRECSVCGKAEDIGYINEENDFWGSSTQEYLGYEPM